MGFNGRSYRMIGVIYYYLGAVTMMFIVLIFMIHYEIRYPWPMKMAVLWALTFRGVFSGVQMMLIWFKLFQ